MRSAPKWTEFPKYPVVAGTAIVAVAVSIAWWSRVDVSALFETAMIRRGEVWRLITAIFPHVNLLHLAFNIYWLWVFGTLVESVYGHFRAAALIAIFAVGSGSLEFALSTGGVGLSGVGYGLFALLWVLSRHDDRFRDTVGSKTVQLFVGWFLFCAVTTLLHIYSVGNIAHAAGAILGALTGAAIVYPQRRTLLSAGIGIIVLFGLWGSTLGRPRINRSANAGYEEGQWGYAALQSNRNQEAVRWLRDASAYQPKLAVYWFDLGIAYHRLGNMPAAKAAYEKAYQLEPANAEYSETVKGLD